MRPCVATAAVTAVVLLLCCHAAPAAKASDASRPTRFTVEHALDGVDFTPRGDVTPTRRGVRMEDVSLSASDKAALQDLAARGGYYRIRVTPSGSPGSGAVFGSMKACALVTAKLKHNVVLHFTPEGALTAASVELPESFRACDANVEVKGSVMKAAAVARGLGDGDSIPVRATGGTPYPGQQAAATPQKGEAIPVENQSFFSRYAYIIVPVGILYVCMGLGAAGQQGGGGARRS